MFEILHLTHWWEIAWSTLRYQSVFRSWLNFGHQLNPALLGKKFSRSGCSTVVVAPQLQLQLRLNPPWISLLFLRWNHVLRSKTYRNNIKVCFYFRWKASKARILTNMADLFSKQEKTRDILNLQKSRNNGDRIKFRGIFSWMNLFAITNGMVKVLVEGCFGSDLFDLTNISNSFSCFLATYREKFKNDPMFPIWNLPLEHSLHSAYIVSMFS